MGLPVKKNVILELVPDYDKISENSLGDTIVPLNIEVKGTQHNVSYNWWIFMANVLAKAKQEKRAQCVHNAESPMLNLKNQQYIFLKIPQSVIGRAHV